MNSGAGSSLTSPMSIPFLIKRKIDEVISLCAFLIFISMEGYSK
jgi:hypothetical protein